MSGSNSKYPSSWQCIAHMHRVIYVIVFLKRFGYLDSSASAEDERLDIFAEEALKLEVHNQIISDSASSFKVSNVRDFK